MTRKRLQVVEGVLRTAGEWFLPYDVAKLVDVGSSTVFHVMSHEFGGQLERKSRKRGEPGPYYRLNIAIPRECWGRSGGSLNPFGDPGGIAKVWKNLWQRPADKITRVVISLWGVHINFESGLEFSLGVDDITRCNCAECRVRLLGDSMKVWYDKLDGNQKKHFPEPVYCRIDGRPYCRECCLPTIGMGNSCPFWDPEAASPWGENAIRAMEDAPAVMEPIDLDLSW